MLKSTNIQETGSAALSLLSWNIDTNIIRTEDGDASDTHPAWRANARAEAIKKTLEATIDSGEDHPDIIQIQECRKFTDKKGDEVDSLTGLTEFLENKGYKVLVKDYNPSGGKSFKYITAYDPNRLDLKESKIKYFTKTPDEPTDHKELSASKENFESAIGETKDHNYGTVWERGAFINEFVDKKSQEPIVSINAHLDIKPFTKTKSCEKIVEFAQEIADKNPKVKILASGDFNIFPENPQSKEALEKITKATQGDEGFFEDATEKAVFTDGTKASYSFIPFPYDSIVDNKPSFSKTIKEMEAMEPDERKECIDNYYKEKCQATGGMLDRVFVHGHDEVECKVMPFGLLGAMSGFTEKEMKEYVTKGLEPEVRKPAFASDHAPILTKVSFSAKSAEKLDARSNETGQVH